MQALPDLNLQVPSGSGNSAGRSISPISSSPSGSTDENHGNARDAATGEETTQGSKKQYDKWTNEEQKALLSLWADRHERLESKDARKIWDEIAREINRKFGTTRTGEKCQKKIKYHIERYKKAKDWNSKQTGGHRWKTVFYDEIDAVLGCRDVVYTLRHVAEAGTSASTSAPNSNASESNNSELPGQNTSPEARTERKKKRKRARPEEEDEEGDLIKSSLPGMEKQRKEMNKFMENFTRVQEQQANTMNALVGALTNFLQNSSNNNK